MKCNQEGCTEYAIYTLVWDKPKFYCLEHANDVLHLADAMGFPTPQNTVRLMTLQEIQDYAESEAHESK